MKKIEVKKDFGMIDAIILAVQGTYKCKIVSGDHHFQDMKDVIFLKK